MVYSSTEDREVGSGSALVVAQVEVAGVGCVRTSSAGALGISVFLTAACLGRLWGGRSGRMRDQRRIAAKNSNRVRMMEEDRGSRCL